MRALQQDIYEAHDLFLIAGRSPEGVVDETPHICQPDERLIHTGYNYPMFALVTPPTQWREAKRVLRFYLTC